MGWLLESRDDVNKYTGTVSLDDKPFAAFASPFLLKRAVVSVHTPKSASRLSRRGRRKNRFDHTDQHPHIRDDKECSSTEPVHQQSPSHSCYQIPYLSFPSVSQTPPQPRHNSQRTCKPPLIAALVPASEMPTPSRTKLM